MQRVRTRVFGIFHLCWTILFGLLFFAVLLRVQVHPVLKLLPFLGFFLLLQGFRRLRPRLDSASDRFFRIAVMLFLALEATVFFLLAREMCVVPFTDTGVIWFSAADVAETGTLSPEFDQYCTLIGARSSRAEYFLIYPGSRFMVAFLLPYCRLLRNIFGVALRSSTGYFCASCLNILFLLLTELFIVLSARKAGGKSCGLLACLFCFAFFPYALHAFKLYSDTMSMPFVSLAVYLVICAKENEGRSRLLLLTAGLTVGVGALLKGSVLILGCAVLLYLLFNGGDCRRKLLGTGAFAAGLLAVCMLWGLCMDRLPWLDTAEADRYELPIVHWFMMGSDGDGGFSAEDYEYSLQFETLAERKAGDRAEFLRRVRGRGTAGYLKFCAGKITDALADGMYYQRNHLGYLKDTSVYRLLRSRPVKICCALFPCLLYIGFLLSGWLGIREDNGILFLFCLCFLGVILFFAFWECKSRYLLNYTPVFLLNTVLVIARFPTLRRTVPSVAQQ